MERSINKENGYEEMQCDSEFMSWLKEYLPNWEYEYSGGLLAMWDAWKAGYTKAGG